MVVVAKKRRAKVHGAGGLNIGLGKVDARHAAHLGYTTGGPCEDGAAAVVKLTSGWSGPAGLRRVKATLTVCVVLYLRAYFCHSISD